MASDIGELTIGVLEAGLPPLPAQIAAGEPVPAAAWRGERYGAVLFIRHLKNGIVDYDCAISERAADGSWERPGSWGGTGWIDNPFVRSETGWDGDPVAWIGRSTLDKATALLGAASSRVADIEVTQHGRSWTVPIETSWGAFIVGLEEPGAATLRALDQAGKPLVNADGTADVTI